MDTWNSIMDAVAWIGNAATKVMEFLNKGLALLPKAAPYIGKIVPFFEKLIAFFKNLSEGGSFDWGAFTAIFK